MCSSSPSPKSCWEGLDTAQREKALKGVREDRDWPGLYKRMEAEERERREEEKKERQAAVARAERARKARKRRAAEETEKRAAREKGRS